MANNNPTKRGHSLLAFFLGLLVGVVLVGGIVAGVIAFILNLKVDSISANKDGDGNYIFINGDPDDGGVGTVMDLVKKLGTMAKDYNSLSLGEMEVLIPAVGKLTDKLDDGLGQFVRLEEGELQAVKIGELSDFVKGLANRVNIATLIGPTPDNAILTYLCYGVSGITYADGGWKGQFKAEDGKFHECFFEMNESNGKISEAYYVDENGEKVFAPYLTLDNVSKRVDGVCNDLTVGEIITDIPDNDRILGSIKNSTINTISDDLNSICVQQLFPDDIYARGTAAAGQTNPVAETYLAVTDTPMPAADYYDNYIYYEYDTDSNSYKLAGGGNGKLTAEEFSNGAYFTCGEGKILFDDRFVYYTKKDGALEMVNKGLQNEGKISVFDTNADYYTYGGTSPLWKLLLYTEDDDGVLQETVYNFKNINTMITNVSANTQNSTLRELDAAGILTFTNKADLEKPITFLEGGNPVNSKVGDLELTRAIGLFVAYSNLISSGAIIPSP